MGVVILGTAGILLTSVFVWQQMAIQKSAVNYADEQKVSRMIEHDLYRDLSETRAKIARLEDDQTKHGVKVVEDTVVQDQLNGIKHNIPNNNIHAARVRLKKLNDNIAAWQVQIDAQIKAQDLARQRAAAAALTPPLAPPAVSAGYLQVPILMYHYTPTDFETQMKQLIAKKYTTIDLDQLSAALRSKASLPPKPVVITFDDDRIHHRARQNLNV